MLCRTTTDALLFENGPRIERGPPWVFLRPAGGIDPETRLATNFKRVFMNISLYAFRERFTPAGARRY